MSSFTGATIFKGLLFIAGLVLLFGFPVYHFSKGSKLEKDEYTLNIFIPSMIGLFLLFVALSLHFYFNYDEKNITIVSTVLAIGGIGIALMASHFSELRVYYYAN
jgi:hypothetical protein